MHRITYGKSHFGSTPLTICHYKLKEDITPMNTFDRIYIHNTYKHTNLEDLLIYSWRRGLAGIGYHFAIDPKGTIYATRPISIMGAHIYGQNKESVGIVFLNADQCAQSKNSITCFQQLYSSLCNQVEQKLPLRSHSYGQLEYINQQIKKYNHNIPTKKQIPIIPFDESICEEEILEQKRLKLYEILQEIKLTNIPTESKPQLQIIHKLSEELKVCPGKSYYQFLNAITKK